MLSTSMRRTALLVLLAIGCSSPSKNRQPPAPTTPVVGRGTPAAPKPLAIDDRPRSPARPTDEIDDKGLLIPPPPKLEALVKAPAEPPAPIKPINPNLELVKAIDVKAPLASNDPAAISIPTEVLPIGPVDPPAPADELVAAMKRIYLRAAAAYMNPEMDAFEARLTRRESINGKPNPEEVIRFMMRKKPYSVRLKWLGTEGQGREVLYVDSLTKMFVMPTKSDSFPLPPRRMTFAPDDSIVRSKARHDIRDAGFSAAIKHLGTMLGEIEKNPSQRSRFRYLGAVQRPEFQSKLEALEETIPPRAEALLPQGGKRFTFWDTAPNAKSAGLPVLVTTYDAAAKEVEYYRFDNFMYPVRLKDEDFDPDQVFRKK